MHAVNHRPMLGTGGHNWSCMTDWARHPVISVRRVWHKTICLGLGCDVSTTEQMCPPVSWRCHSGPRYMGRRVWSLERINSIRKQTVVLTHVTHVNGWFPAIYMSYMSSNFRFFLVSNKTVLNFRIFLLMYPISYDAGEVHCRLTVWHGAYPALRTCDMVSGSRICHVSAAVRAGHQMQLSRRIRQWVRPHDRPADTSRGSIWSPGETGRHAPRLHEQLKTKVKNG